MDWNLIIAITIPSVAAVLITDQLTSGIALRREAACEHSFTKIPVWDTDDPDAERPAQLLAFCEKCGCKREIA